MVLEGLPSYVLGLQVFLSMLAHVLGFVCVCFHCVQLSTCEVKTRG